MEFRQIQYFICLYEEGSVTRAAHRLNIVQPALSMQISKLEEEVGQILFIRSARGMEPTSEGRRMYRLFLPVLGDFARARAEVMQTGAELAGEVRVGMIATIAEGALVDALMEFEAAHPKVELSLTDGFSGALADAVAVGQLDAAVINKPRRSLKLNTELIAEEDMLLVAGPVHAPLPVSARFSQLKDMKLVLPTRQHGLRGIIESFAQGAELELSPRLEIDSISAILNLVRRSDFCTLLPRVAVKRDIENGALSGCVLRSPRLARQIVCVTHPRRPPNSAALAFLATLSRHVRRLADSAPT